MTKKEWIDTIVSICYVVFFSFVCWFILVITSSCSTTHTVQAQGRTLVITTDTTVINHGGNIHLKTTK